MATLGLPVSGRETPPKSPLHTLKLSSAPLNFCSVSTFSFPVRLRPGWQVNFIRSCVNEGGEQFTKRGRYKEIHGEMRGEMRENRRGTEVECKQLMGLWKKDR